MPAISDGCCVHLMLCNVSKIYSLELVNIIDLGRYDVCIIVADCMLHIL